MQSGSDPISAKRHNASHRADAAAGSDAAPGQRTARAADQLLDALPDLALLIGKDGLVIAAGGGRDAAGMRPGPVASGKPLEASWPASVAAFLKQVTRKAIAQRTSIEARFMSGGREYTARVSPRGPDRAVCVVRAPVGTHSEDPADSGARPAPQLDRRGFLQRFKESLSWAALRETPVALAVIHIDGVADIAQVLASQLSEQVMSAAIRRLPLPPQGSGPAGASPQWYLGQLSEALLAMVIESADRDAIETCVTRVCASLRDPVRAGDAEFHLTPSAGVALLGQDASTPKLLLEQARAAAMEARRAGAGRGMRFFTDTMKIRALARIDLARELRNAVSNSDIRLRYAGRYDLERARLATCVGYLHWPHPLRGEIRPAEFLRLAEATGLSAPLSRAVLTRLRGDFTRLAAVSAPEVRISFGALRHHVLHEEFVDDVARLIAAGGIPADRLELRIAEKVFITREPAHFEPLQRLGLRLVVDEVGRGVGSLDLLARAPIWGLQLDRAWVAALRADPVARKVCRAGIRMATALGLVPIATGVDDAETRDALLELGCTHGSGDLYRNSELDITSA